MSNLRRPASSSSEEIVNTRHSIGGRINTRPDLTQETIRNSPANAGQQLPSHQTRRSSQQPPPSSAAAYSARFEAHVQRQNKENLPQYTRASGQRLQPPSFLDKQAGAHRIAADDHENDDALYEAPPSRRGNSLFVSQSEPEDAEDVQMEDDPDQGQLGAEEEPSGADAMVEEQAAETTEPQTAINDDDDDDAESAFEPVGEPAPAPARRRVLPFNQAPSLSPSPVPSPPAARNRAVSPIEEAEYSQSPPAEAGPVTYKRLKRIADREMEVQKRMMVPYKVQRRRPWTNEASDRLIELIGKHGCAWSLIEGLNEPTLAGRDQVALKDRARNIKIDILKYVSLSLSLSFFLSWYGKYGDSSWLWNYRSGLQLPDRFQFVPIKTKDRQKLIDMGINMQD
jgi:hypothetical protein